MTAPVAKDVLVLKLHLRSDPTMLCVIRAAVGEMASSVGFDEKEVRSTVLAVDEAMTNVIRHAYRGRFDRPIEVCFYRGQEKTGEGIRDSLEVRIVDQGEPVNIEELRGRALDEIRPGGLGLHFIRETMDRVTFRHVRGRNYLRLIRFLTPAKPGDTHEGALECR
jgi:serine/threonine-protein kinase RsbW